MRDDGLAELFWAVARDLRARTRSALSPWEITPSQSRAIAVLAAHEPQRLSDLAERLRIAPRSTTEVVDQLQAADLIERRPDPADRRATLVVLTPAGRTAAAAIRQARLASADQYFAALPPADRADLTRILAKLAASGEQTPNAG